MTEYESFSYYTCCNLQYFHLKFAAYISFENLWFSGHAEAFNHQCVANLLIFMCSNFSFLRPSYLKIIKNILLSSLTRFV
jgi:hypothetical protein